MEFGKERVRLKIWEQSQKSWQKQRELEGVHCNLMDHRAQKRIAEVRWDPFNFSWVFDRTYLSQITIVKIERKKWKLRALLISRPCNSPLSNITWCKHDCNMQGGLVWFAQIKLTSKLYCKVTIIIVSMKATYVGAMGVFSSICKVPHH